MLFYYNLDFVSIFLSIFLINLFLIIFIKDISFISNMHPHICSICGKWFPGLGDIMYHIDTVHSAKFTNKSTKLISSSQDKTKDKANTEQNTN